MKLFPRNFFKKTMLSQILVNKLLQLATEAPNLISNRLLMIFTSNFPM